MVFFLSGLILTNGNLRYVWLPLVFVCASVSSLFAGDPTSEKRPNFLLHDIHGKQYHGPLQAILPDWTCQLKSGQATKVLGKHVLFLNRDKLSLPPFPKQSQFILTSGDRFAFEKAFGIQQVGGKFQIRSPMQFGEKPRIDFIPRAVVSVLWLGNKGPLSPEVEIRKLLKRPRKTDEVYLHNGDRIDGIFISLDHKAGCKIRLQKSNLQIPFRAIKAIAFQSDLLFRMPTKKPLARLVLTGSDVCSWC